MSRQSIPITVRKEVALRAKERCEYCLTQILISGQAMHIDHIIPESRGGSAELSNLCLACACCNQHKAAQTTGIDGESGLPIALFNPRQHQWTDHFRWQTGVFIEGITPTGTVTGSALNMNNEIIVASRLVWVRFGLHPPAD